MRRSRTDFYRIKEFDEPAVVVVKHLNPCGCAMDDDIRMAYRKAYEGDVVSAFGGIIALNRKVDVELAHTIMESYSRFGKALGASGFFAEVIVDSDYDWYFKPDHDPDETDKKIEHQAVIGRIAVGYVGQGGRKSPDKRQARFNRDKGVNEKLLWNLGLDQAAESHPEKHEPDNHGPLFKGIAKNHGGKACLDILKNNTAGPACKHAGAQQH